MGYIQLGATFLTETEFWREFVHMIKIAFSHAYLVVSDYAYSVWKQSTESYMYVNMYM